MWTIDEICQATDGRATGLDVGLPITGVSIDSRTIGAGELFVAIKGDRFDGHDFVAKALEQGAIAALVSAGFAQDHPEMEQLIVVTDALEGLEHLGVAARQRMQGKVIAVTGSVGKTSTKEAIRITLEQFGKTHFSIKSFNNHWGVPLMLARMPADTEFAVFELGMSHENEIRPLVKLVSPHLAVITKIAPAHLENFQNLQGIADAKAEIFEGLQSGGSILLGADHDYVDYLRGRAAGLGFTDVTTFGFAAQADLVLGEPHLHNGHIGCGFGWKDEAGHLDVPQLGAHALANAACAYLIGRKLGIAQDDLLWALGHYHAASGRGEVAKLPIADGHITLVDESYNANPASMLAAIDTLARNQHQGRNCVVLGDMLELGEESANLHRSLAEPLIKLAPDQVLLVGPMMRHLFDAVVDHLPVDWVENQNEVLPKLSNWLAPGDLIMVKGSNGIGLGALVEACRKKWPPTEE
nr:UDP-N-acetylmuramoyl-tripeptide--D-alanyl-D-alanine ligase [Maritalea mediterranea]